MINSVGENIPDLYSWIPSEEDIYYRYENEVVVASYDKVGMIDSPLSVYYINKNHYKKRMPDIIQHTNFFLKFYDANKELFMATLSIKFIIDQNKNISEKAVRELVLDRIITEDFIARCKKMADDICVVDMNTDTDGKYKNTPKITNEQAKRIFAVSFAFRFILPLMIHYSNVGEVFKSKPKTYYLECFGKLFRKIIKYFEKDDVKIFTTLCKFIDFRVKKSYSSNKLIHYQKKQIRGDSVETYTDDLIIYVTIVKSLYKLDYRRSCVSFIDGVTHNFNANYGRENYRNTPYEIDSSDLSNDFDDVQSRAEALEMEAYNIDESNPMISDANIRRVLESINHQYRAIEITKEELDFYMENCKMNEITQFLLHSFYSKRFNDSYAMASINKETTIKLLLYMKKIFELSKMPLLSQICTAKITSKYRESVIKNNKFLEGILTSNIYQKVISEKFKYIKELDTKDDPILRMLSAIINCTFEFVDINPQINGFVLSNINTDDIVNEFLQFLSIV